MRYPASMEPISIVPLEIDDGARAPEGSLGIAFDGAHVVVRGEGCVRGAASAMIGRRSDLKVVLV